MGVTRTVDLEHKLLRATWSGRVRGEDLMNGVKSLLVNPDHMALGRSIADLREADLELTPADFSSTLLGAIAPGLRDGQWRIALLIASPLQYGICRQFLAFSASHVVGEVFYAEADALAWLQNDH